MGKGRGVGRVDERESRSYGRRPWWWWWRWRGFPWRVQWKKLKASANRGLLPAGLVEGWFVVADCVLEVHTITKLYKAGG